MPPIEPEKADHGDVHGRVRAVQTGPKGGPGPFLLSLEAVDACDSRLTGSKGSNLATMIRRQFPVPYGVVLTVVAYEFFIRSAEFEIDRFHVRQKEPEPGFLDAAAARVRQAIERAKFPRVQIPSVTAPR